ncbi:DUF1254 domain-containing protein (plasmid) [Novosphingobium sp. BL-8A]|uniref:DUF1254 domain-containing protein n=1 Tax=Novosphingobium sp. BL-8A TaxID=3127639 RepID=UPI003757D017
MSDDLTNAKLTTDPSVSVDRANFVRAETDNYFKRFVGEGGLGKFVHNRELVDLDHQLVIRMNRDTIYSQTVLDLNAGPVTITLPDTGGRFLSALVIDEDHYVIETFYDSAPHRFARGAVNTRYIAVLLRTFVDPSDPADLRKVHALQDAITVEQPGGPGTFEVPDWEKASLDATRAELCKAKVDLSNAFGKPDEVDPGAHLIATAMGWGGNPPRDAVYLMFEPAVNDGKTKYRLTVKDVPVDGFWSVTVYNKDGYFEKNPQNAYSINNVTAKRDADGSVSIQFGSCDGSVANCLPITPGWGYSARLYRPRAEVLNGNWTFPEAKRVD